MPHNVGFGAYVLPLVSNIHIYIKLRTGINSLIRDKQRPAGPGVTGAVCKAFTGRLLNVTADCEPGLTDLSSSKV